MNGENLVAEGTQPSNVGSDGYTDPGNHANYNNSGYTIGSPYYRTKIGGFENSASSYGTFDQGGNVGEWNDTILFGSYRGWRGGSFVSDPVLMRGSYRNYNYPVYEGYDVGFRLTYVPEPATMRLLLLTGVGLLRRKRT